MRSASVSPVAVSVVVYVWFVCGVCEFVFVWCMHVCVCVSEGSHVCTCVWRPEVNLSLPQEPSTLPFETVGYWVPALTKWLGWLTQGSSHFCLPSAGVCEHTALHGALYMGAGVECMHGKCCDN